jgi:ubiquinone biosynthesis protein
MDVATIPQLVRNTARFGDVTSVLAKYGLAGWLTNVRAEWVQQLFRGPGGKEICDEPPEVRIRLALAELGTTYIKLGQILSTRPDLVGPELATELCKLQSGTPVDPPEVVRETLTAELGASAEDLFLEFDDKAMASASVAQVHRARTKDGTAVVVKVQHKGIEKRIRNDLEILTQLAKLAERFAPQLKQFQPVETSAEFSRTLLRELDFGREANNMRQFAKNFQDDPSIRFPTVYPELSTRRILTMDYLQGTSVSDTESLRSDGHDLSDLARRGANMFVDMIFRDGFYHADPHPGNLLILSGDAIGVLDCGMVGRLDDDLREQIEDMLLAAVDQDSQRLTEIVVRLGQVPVDLDRERLQSEIDEFLADYGDQSIGDFDVSGALNGIIAIIRQHGIILPARASLLLKVLVMLEGTSRQLSPDFSLVELLKPYREKAIQRRLSPQRMWRKLQTAYRDWNHLAEILPGDVADILHRVKRGSFDVHLEHRRLETSINRLVMGIISAALFVGSATLWSSKVPPVLWGYSVPGAVGCGFSAVLAWRLLRAIQRSGSIE